MRCPVFRKYAGCRIYLQRVSQNFIINFNHRLGYFSQEGVLLVGKIKVLLQQVKTTSSVFCGRSSLVIVIYCTNKFVIICNQSFSNCRGTYFCYMLTHFWSMSNSIPPWKHQGIKWEHWLARNGLSCFDEKIF